jgi:Rieske Fe-S protein
MSATVSTDPDRLCPLGRRDFLSLATRALLWATGGATAFGLSRYLAYEPEPAKASRFTLEAPAAFPPGARVLVGAAGAAVYHDADGFFARSLTCGHLGCRVQPSDDGGFDCPCHGSRFSRDGARLKGPTPSDLKGLALELDRDGNLVLDLDRPVDCSWRLEAGVTVDRDSTASHGSEG